MADISDQTPSTSTEDIATPFRFLDLPAGMRNRIYDHAAQLAFEVPVAIACSSPERSAVQSTRRTKPWAAVDNESRELPRNRLALLFVNRQVNKEAAGIFR